MLTVESVDPLDRGAVHRFLRLPFRLYAGHPLWVPPLWIDAATQLNPRRHRRLDVLVEGFEFRPAMTMMNYNPPYYPCFLESLGYEKEVDFISCYLNRD